MTYAILLVSALGLILWSAPIRDTIQNQFGSLGAQPQMMTRLLERAKEGVAPHIATARDYAIRTTKALIRDVINDTLK